jgi:hypothetical protein
LRNPCEHYIIEAVRIEIRRFIQKRKECKSRGFWQNKGEKFVRKKGKNLWAKTKFWAKWPKIKPNEENVQKRKKKEISKSLIIYCE